ncbi:mini-chromosome maintenance replisome factor-domain-containing protein [Mycena albidolilacea]|uniref:Mini-chromosome maintenance replisome factor-domain-containing protein n=1 Tax=Mycena albidolilacea TaxID=1033008 RepID=A0AAD7A5G1_9AGAR|nr:mini-chromosome maintenance replisome factor-domain-containing protein [Mycena albidolilacea]
MVSSVPVDAISDPTRSLLDLYDANPHIDDFPAKVAAHFADIFASKDAFSEIPSIYTVDPRQRDRCLVSFRAMIQDTSPSPEMYLAKRSNGQCGGWGLADDASPDDINYADLRENTVVWAVNVPGESEWVASELDGPNVPSFTRSIHPESHHPHKFPIPGAPHLGVQVKVYDTSRADLLKSTDVVTLVGILTMESITSDSDLEPENDVLVPTLHVLFSRPLPLPLAPRIFPYSPVVSNLDTLRDELISWIATEGLAGDKDAAEWVLLNIIAKVQSRTPPLLPPSLTLSRFPPPTSASSTPSLCTVLSHLLPIVVTLPLSLDLLNTSLFSPESKNEELCSGRLQLPRGTTCIVTEGGITEGGLVERGIVNLRALQEIMTNQSLEYVFPFSRFAFQTDVACLVLSEGRKSTFFQTHINVPLRPEAGKSAELYKPANQVKLPSAETLTVFRDYLGAAKIGSVTIGDTVAEYIQEDFVKERKAAATPAAAVTSEHLIHRMTVARLLTLSMHQSEVSIDIWERAKAMEAARETRLDTLSTQ